MAQEIVDQEEAIELERDRRWKARREVRIQSAKAAVPRVPTVTPATKRKVWAIFVRWNKIGIMFVMLWVLIALLANILSSIVRS